jgi:hypothetical protein
MGRGADLLVEVASSLARRSASRPTTPPSEIDLRNAFEAHGQELIKVQIDDPVFQRVRSLAWDLQLRGADSIHLCYRRFSAHTFSASFGFSDSADIGPGADCRGRISGHLRPESEGPGVIGRC